MVSTTNYGRFSQFLGAGECGMEIVLLMLLVVPLTAASPLRLPKRSEADVALSGRAVQAVDVGRLENGLQQHAPLLKIVPFHSEDKQLKLEALKHSMAAKIRPRRATQRGCQLGTCQLHNLANTLYHISKTSGKEESKKANDPQGFGR